MNNRFFERPILDSPDEYPSRHWELDDTGQPTRNIVDNRRSAQFITPIPRPKKQRHQPVQASLLPGDRLGLSTADQQYDPWPVINTLRQSLLEWRRLPEPHQWRVMPETARLLQHWRHHRFTSIRPFFCQIEAVETLIWLTESDFSLMDAIECGIVKPPRETVQVKAMRPERDHLEIRFPRVAGYRVELAEERLVTEFNEDSVLEFTPDLVGPSITKNQGIIGQGVDPSLEHLQDMRRSTLLFHLTQRLLYTRWRDPGAEQPLHLFGQLKRITRRWPDHCLVCKGGTWAARLMYQELGDMACERITAGITRALVGERPVKAVFDPYNPVGSTAHVNFTTSKTSRWETHPEKCHINRVILDSDWEAEFGRVAESHPKVLAYVKNHGLGLEAPYRYGSETRTYIPDFIVQVDDGCGKDDPLNLIVEIKGYRREDAKEKKAAMENYWVPGVNNHGQYGRWAFVDFTDVCEMQDDFEKKIRKEFDKMLASVTGDS